MASTNHQAAKLFQEMADVLLLLKADRFKVGAFQKVAQALGTYPEDIAAIGPDEKKLRKIPGVGEGSAKRIAEFLRTGKIADHQELCSQVPPGLRTLLVLPGLGPRGVEQLWKEAGVCSI